MTQAAAATTQAFWSSDRRHPSQSLANQSRLPRLWMEVRRSDGGK